MHRRDPQYPYLEPNRPSLEPKKITRVDVYEQKDGLLIKKYSAGWTASTPPLTKSVNTEWTLERAAEWLKENGWIVHVWPGGCRAWWEKVLPVRTRAQILRMREEYMRCKPHPDMNVCTMDFANDG